MDKLMSGRLWFTLVTAIVFGLTAWTCKLNNEQVVSVIMLVVAFYFGRNDRTPTKGA
jgi:hypothetical protein